MQLYVSWQRNELSSISDSNYITYSKIAPNIQARVVCLSEHTYTYAISILKELSRTEKGWIKGTCEAISDQLRKYIPERIYDTTSLRTAIACTAQDQVRFSHSKMCFALFRYKSISTFDILRVPLSYIRRRNNV